MQFTQWSKAVGVGSVVSYSDVNQWTQRGKVERIQGNKAWVVWDRFQHLGPCEDYLPNLIAWLPFTPSEDED